MKESIVQARGITFMRGLGADVIRLNSGKLKQNYTNKDGNTKGRMVILGEKGNPDTFNCVRGDAVYIEYKKTPKERDLYLKKWGKWNNDEPFKADKRVFSQFKRRREIEAAGGCYIVAAGNEDIVKGMVEGDIITIEEIPLEYQNTWGKGTQ